MVVATQMGVRLRFVVVFFALCGVMRAAEYHVVVAGLGGTAEYEKQFAKWAEDLGVALKKNGPESHVTVLSGPAATRERVQQKLQEVASAAKSGDEFGLFLIGHGTFDNEVYKFNVPGPDLTATELAGLLNRISAWRQTVVDMTSASGAALTPLARKGRVVITATKSGNEKNLTVFPRFWMDALQDPSADTNKDGSVSVLEAYEYARAKCAAYFEGQKLLATEHAQLDDNGAATGVPDPGPKNGQGLLARQFMLLQPDSGASPNVSAKASGAKRELLVRKQGLEAKIDKLKYEKPLLPENDYKQQMGRLLLDLARVQAEIDRP